MVLKSVTLRDTTSQLSAPEDEVFQDPSANGEPLVSLRSDNLDLIFEVLLGQVFPFRGFVLFDQTGKLLRHTTKAEDFFVLLRKASPGQVFGTAEGKSPMGLPGQVTTLCNFLIDSRSDFPDYALQLYDTVFLPGGIRLYLKTEWIDLADQPTKCILVTIEDLTQIAHHRAVCDAYRYGLTTREAEVWELYLQGFSYREVSQELVIALNTVKKHMKGIFSKCNIECRCRHLV